MLNKINDDLYQIMHDDIPVLIARSPGGDWTILDYRSTQRFPSINTAANHLTKRQMPPIPRWYKPPRRYVSKGAKA